MATCEALAPSFNTLVAFSVPRLHAVAAVAKGKRRYSLVGWWLAKAKAAKAKDKAKAKTLKRPAGR